MKLIFKVLHINEYFAAAEPAAAMTIIETENCVKARNISTGSITNIPAQMLSFDEKELGRHVELGDEFEFTITRKSDADNNWPADFQ